MGGTRIVVRRGVKWVARIMVRGGLNWGLGLC